MTDEQAIYRRHWDDSWTLSMFTQKPLPPEIVARLAAEFISLMWGSFNVMWGSFNDC